MESSTKSVLIAIIATIIICVVIGGVLYYLLVIKSLSKKSSTTDTQTSQNSQSTSADTMDTSSWPTYTNAQFGYSFRYPSNYKVVDNCFDSTQNKRIEYENPKWLVILAKETQSDFPYCESDFPQPFFDVRVINEAADINLEKQGSTTDIEAEKIVAGQKWVSFTSTEPSEMDESYSTTLRLNYGGKSYGINWGNSDGKGTHDPIIDAILKTFQFVK